MSVEKTLTTLLQWAGMNSRVVRLFITVFAALHRPLSLPIWLSDLGLASDIISRYGAESTFPGCVLRKLREHACMSEALPERSGST